MVTRWSVRLSTSSFALDEALRGETELARSASLAGDCVVLVLALCDLELQVPGAIAVLSDERGLFRAGQRPREVDLVALRRRAEQLELEATQLALERALRRLTSWAPVPTERGG